MATRMIPEVGHWYAHRDKGQMFQVVAFDADDGYVEIQDFDGDVDEVDLDTWFSMPLDPAEAPEDWTGPVDELDADDRADLSGAGTTSRDWRSPIDDIPGQVQEAIESDESEDGSAPTTH